MRKMRIYLKDLWLVVEVEVGLQKRGSFRVNIWCITRWLVKRRGMILKITMFIMMIMQVYITISFKEDKEEENKLLLDAEVIQVEVKWMRFLLKVVEFSSVNRKVVFRQMRWVWLKKKAQLQLKMKVVKQPKKSNRQGKQGNQSNMKISHRFIHDMWSTFFIDTTE